MKILWPVGLIFFISSCMNVQQLTHSNHGHTLHHNGVFSNDGDWIVFDGRNDDTKIGENNIIGIVNISGESEKIIYQTQNPTLYGPGAGAASFSPATDRVIFIHGLPDADAERPYDMTRRTGVGIDLAKPFQPINMDARDLQEPYLPGTLRGGTHSHAWSGEGKLISFTYNDELIQPELRTVGVMIPANEPLQPENIPGNNPGVYYSAIIADVKSDPGSNEISKAFDECWVGKNGYINSKGDNIKYAIAFQGNVMDNNKESKTEIFIVDIDPDIILKDKKAVGKAGERPHVPYGIQSRRLTNSEMGLSNTRHWLRSSPDGSYIYALAKDKYGNNQIIRAQVNSGEMEWMTSHQHSIDYPFNLNAQGTKIAYIAQNSLYIFDLQKKSDRLIFKGTDTEKITGAPSFSNDNSSLIFNQYKRSKDGNLNLQIMKLNLK